MKLTPSQYDKIKKKVRSQKKITKSERNLLLSWLRRNYGKKDLNNLSNKQLVKEIEEHTL